jgi:hypothetical protein
MIAKPCWVPKSILSKEHHLDGAPREKLRLQHDQDIGRSLDEQLVRSPALGRQKGITSMRSDHSTCVTSSSIIAQGMRAVTKGNT